MNIGHTDSRLFSLEKTGSMSVASKKEVKKDKYSSEETNKISSKQAVLEYKAIQNIKTNEKPQEYNISHKQDRFGEAVIYSEKSETGIEALEYLSESDIKLRQTIAMQIMISDLKSTDTKVKTHERAHVNAGGIYVSAPVYDFEVGPDGRQYAVAGSVSIDTSKVANNPAATIAKMAIIRRAALAPVDPSPSDISIAMKAAVIQAQAKLELRDKSLEDNKIEEYVSRYEDTFNYLEKSPQKAVNENQEQLDYIA